MPFIATYNSYLKEMKDNTIKKQINEFNKQTDTLKNKSVKTKTLKAEIELERLTN